MATLNVYKNPLNARDVDQYNPETGLRVIDWLTENYPNGCGGAVRFFVNGVEEPLDDLDYTIKDDDVVTLVICPAGLTEAILVSLAVSLIMTAVSIGLQMLFKEPEPPAFAAPDVGQVSPVYSIRQNQNQARLGEPVPIVYGSVLHTPDLCSQPYKFYANQRDEYLDMLLCLGEGDFVVDQVLLGDTPVTTLEPGLVQYQLIPPATHHQTAGSLGVVFDAPDLDPAVPNIIRVPFVENMYSSSEVADQEFVNAGDTSGWFRLGKAGQIGRQLYLDFFWPSGLFQILVGGSLGPCTILVDVHTQETDANGNLIGVETVTQLSPTGFNRDPLRLTYNLDLGKASYWVCKLIRISPAYPNGGETTPFLWTGLRLAINNSALPVYGNTTLMAVRLRATQLSSASENSIKVRVKRKLKNIETDVYEVSQNPADAFVDIMVNTEYGAGRPVAEVDIARLRQLRAFWATGGHVYSFNAVYTGRSTVWEALSQCLMPFAAAPLPSGGFMSAVQDGRKPVRTMLFTEQNIIQDSFKLSYSFDDIGAPDGVEVEYRNPDTFAPAYARYPTTGSYNPDNITLFGCTDPQHAMEYARLMWQRRGLNRRLVAYDTEMEGLIPTLGDHIAVAHTLPRWGISGFVVGIGTDRRTIILDRKLKWAEVPGPNYMVFRSNVGGISNMVQVARGDTDDVAIAAADPWAGTDYDWALTLDEEVTHFAWGDGTRAVKDFILTKITPQGAGKVGLSGVYYDAGVFTGTMAFLANTVP